jgi:uncharacterized protein
MSNANVAFVQGLYGAFGRNDIAAVVAGLSPDVDWQTIGPAKGFPIFGARKGNAAAGEFFKALSDNVDFSAFSPQEFHGAADKVFVLGSSAGKIKKTGKPFAVEWAHVFTVTGGKVTKFREHTDTAQFVDGYR